jgi:cobalt-zinc-cadmium efflux system outer membrane protein
LPSVDELLGRAQATRGEVQALQREIDAAKLSERAADRRLVPEPEVVGGTKSSNVAGGDVGSVISIHVSVPLFDRSRPERARAKAQAARGEADLAVFNITLRAHITALRALVAERRDAADRYRASTTSSADLERIAQVSYDAGETGILQLLDAFRSGASVRARQAALDAAARQAEIELEFVSGWEIQ